MLHQICLCFLAFSLIMQEASCFHPVAQAMAPSTSNKGGAENTFYDAKESDSIPLSHINLLELEDELDKRGPKQNFLRFGKSDNPIAAALNNRNIDELTEEDKRVVRNFLRFGRDPHRNFLRFGKSRSPLEFGLDLQPEDIEEIEKKAIPRNYLRYGKAADRNFIRFGRSIDRQLKDACNECDEKVETSSKPAFATDLDTSKYSPESETKKRSKRAVSAFYEDSEFFPHTPLTWNSQFAGLEPVTQTSLILGSNEDLANNAQKRAHSRSFLRYGRDPLDLHFLRFGKRMTSEEMKNTDDVDFGDDYTRYPRARTNKNFIRFG
ncbi:UNVERIFIED_CONTAM: hypothetical protein RMT77_004825 [Armadillidium vulgare]